MTYEMLYGKFESVPANGTVILKVKKFKSGFAHPLPFCAMGVSIYIYN